jgi:excisionase family DNA binding protein
MINKLLTAEDVAAMINCGPSTVYEWAKNGKIPSLKLNGLVRFVPEEVQQWIQKNRQSASDPEKSLGLLSQRVTGLKIDTIIRRTIDAEKKRNYNVP